ncbi:MAG: pyridoxal 5'-phosphate synthase glutaminase subunit PdxT [Francisellaceae bacterium]|jgi:pyridoxal 5'-phosphate synthase pdxT subunit|nr:pyridoxal 5'-phosphate synthase glutaminase subunit PdxT [Francisellaceae bacterium]MBT6207688.1 pyridoxal 5'-phosphate synthase glutaminase subunit PdxT [Francisellaceae bacterium]MBT6538712.1 pyridoxal 5'-phosphate synthase glutaminase subunit PdxT [Francisellaceae bacterium]
MLNIGILALQGGYIAHQNVLAKLEVTSTLITSPSQLDKVHGLIIPGGESSSMIKLLSSAMIDAIHQLHLRNTPILGTCAGSILLARNVEPPQFSFNFINITATRNAYGRQLDSFVDNIKINSANEQLIEAVFIRAPKLKYPGPHVELLAQYDNSPILIKEKNVLLATFHPELTKSTFIHTLFMNECKLFASK